MSERIGTAWWRNSHPETYAIYNANYSPNGRRVGEFPKPWAVDAPDCTFERFSTHADAVKYAMEQATS